MTFKLIDKNDDDIEHERVNKIVMCVGETVRACFAQDDDLNVNHALSAFFGLAASGAVASRLTKPEAVEIFEHLYEISLGKWHDLQTSKEKLS